MIKLGEDYWDRNKELGQSFYDMEDGELESLVTKWDGEEGSGGAMSNIMKFLGTNWKELSAMLLSGGLGMWDRLRKPVKSKSGRGGGGGGAATKSYGRGGVLSGGV